MDEGLDPCFMGLLTDSMVKVVAEDKGDLIADVNFVLGERSLRPYQVRGQIRMIYPNDYDIVAFYLLRQMYGLYFPPIMVVNYDSSHYVKMGDMYVQMSGVNYIVCKQYADRQLQPDDYYPPTEKNFMLRYNLCLLTFFCRFVGVNFSLSDVRVLNGFPFIWRVSGLGYRNAKTITNEEFCYLFGFDKNEARAFNAGLRKSTKLESNDVNNAELIDEYISKQFQVDTPYVPGKNKMVDAVISYFRSFNFDTDIVRSCLYMTENPVRSARGQKAKYKLSRKHVEIERVIEENYGLLSGSYPFKIFRSRN